MLGREGFCDAERREADRVQRQWEWRDVAEERVKRGNVERSECQANPNPMR